MSNLRCRCGHIISDITDNLPYKAYFHADEDDNTIVDLMTKQVADFIEARECGEEQNYLRESVQGYALDEPHLRHPRDLEDTIVYIAYFPISQLQRTMYECEACGRIWIEAAPDKNEYVCYLPESPRRGILRHQGADDGDHPDMKAPSEE